MKRREREDKERINNKKTFKVPRKNRKPLKGWKRWIFLLICLFIIPSFILLVFEICLRILDFGHPSGFYNKHKFKGKVWYTENKKFGWRFFPPRIARSPFEQRISSSKNDKLIRIVILGGSAAMGDPDPSFGFGRILEKMLNSRYPDYRFEVVNAAMTGINSHVVRMIAHDVLKIKPDFFIVYAGNNEVVGPFGSGTVFSPFSRNLFMIRLKIGIESFKIGQILKSCKTLLVKGDAKPSVWGMNLFLEHKIRADDEKLRVSYSHFDKNLEYICKISRKAGVKTILCTVATNLRSCPPFASLHSEKLSESVKKKWDRFFSSGIKKQEDGEYNQASLLFQDALNLDDHYAELHFRMGKCFMKSGQFENARYHFVLARDTDCLRFRADTPINELIRKVASKENTILADVAGDIDQQAMNNIPGDEFFYDHVHLNFSGNYRVALMLAKIIQDELSLSDSGEIPNESHCAQELAYTLFDKHRILKLMLDRMSLPPFTNQMNHSDIMTGKLNQLREFGIFKDSPALSNSMSIYRKALEKNPGDWMLYENFAHLLQNTDYSSEEADMWRGVLKLLPHHPERRASLGQALARAGNYNEAIKECGIALSFDPQNAPAHNGLGMAYAGLNNVEKAKFHYQEALKLKPDYLDARHNLGILFSQIGDSHQVIEHFSKIVSINPDDQDSHFNLATQWAIMKNYQKAVFHFSEVLRINPFHAEALYNLGFISAENGELEKAVEYYSRALKLNPDYSDAHNNLGTLYARMGMFQLSIFHFSEVLRIKPEDPEIHYNLGLAFSNQGDWKKAADHFEQLVQALPQHARGHYQLGLMLERTGRINKALQQYRKALEVQKDWAVVENQLAWVLATHPQSQIRNPDESLDIALKACRHTQFSNPSYLDTLAAAYGSSGKFREALETAGKALNLAKSSNQDHLAQEITYRIELYKQELPFLETEITNAPRQGR